MKILANRILTKLYKPKIMPIILVMYFVSGACALIYEVVWLKMFSLVFGTTVLAATITLASFMCGMAIGSLCFGKLASRYNSSLLLYAILELGIGLFAFVMPWIMDGMEGLFAVIYRNITGSFLGLNVIKLILSFLVLLIPTALMGGTFPVLISFIARYSGHPGYHTGQLYFVNTIGAVGGALASGFYLIAALGINESVYLAGILNLVIAGLTVLLNMYLARASVPLSNINNPVLCESNICDPDTGDLSKIQHLILWAIGISGFCSLAYEVLWTRELIFVLDNTAQAFTTMLTAFLFGISMGSLIVANWLDRSKKLLVWFALAEIFIGLFASFSVPIFNNLGINLVNSSEGIYYPTNSQIEWAAIRFIRSLAVMLIPTILMGMTFPIAIRLYSGNYFSSGNNSGKVYAVNTIGGVLGSISAGLVLVPSLGISRSVLLIAAINTVIGIILLLSSHVINYRKRMTAVFITGIQFVAILAFLTMSYSDIMFTSPLERESMTGVLYYKEDISATVKVYQDVFGDKTLSIDGFPVAGTTPRHQDAQKSLGHFPMLLNQQAQPRVGIVGFGAGGSSWAAMLYDTDYVDCIELVPSVVEASAYFPEINNGVIGDDRLDLISGDGRNYMLVTDKIYDVISVDATSPKSSGSGSLYTFEFYMSCKQHLSANGLMVQWLPYHLMSEDDVKMTAHTFQQAFPHATLWFSFQRYYYILVGTQENLKLDFHKMQYWMAQPGIQQELEPLGISDVYDVLACFIMDEESLLNYTRDSRINTDNHPFLEYDPTSVYLNTGTYVKNNLAAIAGLRQRVSSYLYNTGSNALETQLVLDELEKRIAATPVERFWPYYME
jgi:spermidine synthase